MNHPSWIPITEHCIKAALPKIEYMVVVHEGSYKIIKLKNYTIDFTGMEIDYLEALRVGEKVVKQSNYYGWRELEKDNVQLYYFDLLSNTESFLRE